MDGWMMVGQLDCSRCRFAASGQVVNVIYHRVAHITELRGGGGGGFP